MTRRAPLKVNGHALAGFDREDVSYWLNGSAWNWTALCECGWKSDHRMCSEKHAREAHRLHKVEITSLAEAS